MTLRVMIAGGSGMVGSNVLDQPELRDWIVSAPRRSELDLTNYDATYRHMVSFKPDIVINAAGKVGGIQANIAAPVDFMVTNIDIGRNLIMAAHKAGVRKLLNLGSSCIYPRNSSDTLREDDILKGELEPTNEGYAIAKIFALRLCQYLNRQDPNTSYKTLIPCNLYGRYDHFDATASHLIPAVIRKMHEAKQSDRKTVEIWGDGSARREFMYASDLAGAIVRGIEHFETLPNVLNLGLGRDYAILDYYKAAAGVIGWSGDFVFDLTKPVGMKGKLIDISRQTAWGWHATTSLQDGIAASYAYFLEDIKP